VIHTYHVADNARNIAEKLKLSKEDIELAELIGLLHDIGRFEELKITKELIV
jgi:putative nucleotidyltransferase with HDIG domain